MISNIEIENLDLGLFSSGIDFKTVCENLKNKKNVLITNYTNYSMTSKSNSYFNQVINILRKGISFITLDRCIQLLKKRVINKDLPFLLTIYGISEKFCLLAEPINKEEISYLFEASILNSDGTVKLCISNDRLGWGYEYDYFNDIPISIAVSDYVGTGFKDAVDAMFSCYNDIFIIEKDKIKFIEDSVNNNFEKLTGEKLKIYYDYSYNDFFINYGPWKHDRLDYPRLNSLGSGFSKLLLLLPILELNRSILEVRNKTTIFHNITGSFHPILLKNIIRNFIDVTTEGNIIATGYFDRYIINNLKIINTYEVPDNG